MKITIYDNPMSRKELLKRIQSNISHTFSANTLGSI